MVPCHWHNQRIMLAVISHHEWFRQPVFRIARLTQHSPFLMLLHISIRYHWSVLNSLGSTLEDSCLVSCTGSNEETGCMLHVSSHFPIALENRCGPVDVPSSASNRWQRGSSLVWSRHTFTAKDAGGFLPIAGYYLLCVPCLHWCHHKLQYLCCQSLHSALLN